MEDLYRRAVSQILVAVAQRWPYLSFYLNKRYTTRGLFDKLERGLRDQLATVANQSVLIRQLDSQQSLGIQAADFVAGAFRGKYEYADQRLWKLICDRIVVEEVLTIPLW